MEGFTVLNVKHNENSPVSHMLFMRGLSVKEKVPGKPPEKTLLVAGVPPYCSEDTIKHMFSEFGQVVAVYLHKDITMQLPRKEKSQFFPIQKPIKGFKVAYIVFQKEVALKKVLNLDRALIFPEDHILTGVKKWVKEYNDKVPDVKEMEIEIKQFMDKYDKKLDEKNKRDKDATEADEEGWVTVTKKGRRPGFARKESVTNQLMKKSQLQQKKKQLTNFYRFQVKESKVKNLVAMRQKFEEDKRRIAALKETRRFKPF